MPENRAVVIVTGCGGFIGRAVCKALVTDGYSVVGFDRPDSMTPQPGVTEIPCDVTSEQSVAAAVTRVQRDFAEPIASVIHLAAYYDFSGEPSPLYEQVTVRGTERLLRLLKTAKSEQFVFSSTMLVHAPCEPGQHIDEDWPVDPKWDQFGSWNRYCLTTARASVEKHERFGLMVVRCRPLNVVVQRSRHRVRVRACGGVLAIPF